MGWGHEGEVMQGIRKAEEKDQRQEISRRDAGTQRAPLLPLGLWKNFETGLDKMIVTCQSLIHLKFFHYNKTCAIGE
jgi:hypothetical protein